MKAYTAHELSIIHDFLERCANAADLVHAITSPYVPDQTCDSLNPLRYELLFRRLLGKASTVADALQAVGANTARPPERHSPAIVGPA